MKKILGPLLLISIADCAGQNSFPANGSTVLDAGIDRALVLKDGRSGTNWNYMEWQFSDGSRDWVMGRRQSTGYFTLWRTGINEVFTVDNNGNTGIGTLYPRGKFDVNGPGDIYLNSDPINGAAQSIFLPGHIYIGPHHPSADVAFLQARRHDDSGTTSLRIRTFSNGSLTDAMHIEGNGHIGIGTNYPDAKLSVKGQVHAQEAKVDLNGAVAPDYVFNKDYKLLSLEEIKSYIETNKHLPEVPSAKEMEDKGINVGAMNLLLLKKVEELTLYIITQQEQIDELKNELTSLRK